MRPSGVTHTGQPGPWTIVDFPRRSIVDAVLRTMEWVWPPQISMIFHGRVTVRRMLTYLSSGYGIAILLNELHASPPCGPSSSTRPSASILKSLQGFLFIDKADGETNMHEGVLAIVAFGNVRQTDLFDDAAKAHARCAGEVFTTRAQYLSRHR